MELLWLEYFRELAKSGHLTRTAEKLHIAQPSLSQTLKRLESEVGMPLFDRVGKHIVLNEYGKVFLKYTEQIFSSLDNAKLELNALKEQEHKTVALYVSSASMLLPSLVQQIQKLDENIHLQIFQKYRDGEGEFPYLRLYSSYTCKNEMNTIPLMQECIKIALPKHHPLVKKKRLMLADLKEEPFLSLSPESDLSFIIKHYCEKNDFDPKVSNYIDSAAVMRELLKLNLGVAFVPECTWKDFALDTVVLRSIEDFPMQRYILLTWDDAKYQTNAFKLCKNTIIEYFKEYSSQFQA